MPLLRLAGVTRARFRHNGASRAMNQRRYSQPVARTRPAGDPTRSALAVSAQVDTDQGRGRPDAIALTTRSSKKRTLMPYCIGSARRPANNCLVPIFRSLARTALEKGFAQ